MVQFVDKLPPSVVPLVRHNTTAPQVGGVEKGEKPKEEKKEEVPTILEEATPTPVPVEGYSVKDFNTAFTAKDKTRLNEYSKILKRYNRKRSSPMGDGGKVAEKKTSKPNAWSVHVAKFKAANPLLTYKEVLQQAKTSYKRK